MAGGWIMPKLGGRVAVVTGASRGAGRVSGGSTRGELTTESLPGTIEETAEAVTARGGRGIPVSCDHTEDTQVESLFERVRQEQGHLDLLIHNAWGGYEQHDVEGFQERFRSGNAGTTVL